MHMLKSGTLALIALIITIPDNQGHADDIDLKWASARREANALGDLAKAGDATAVRTLGGLALISGNAPFAHNMGWVHQNGYAGERQGLEWACGFYASAAGEEYPPGMHAYANLCLLPTARRSTGESAIAADNEAMGMLSSSARLGWPASAILYAERKLNRRGPVMKNARSARDIVEVGLAATPTTAQKVTLSYLLGMTAIYANRPRGTKTLQSYRQGEEALNFAASHGHTPAANALSELHEIWLQSLSYNAATWSEPAISLGECVNNIQSIKPDKYLAGSCNGGYILARSLLRHVTEDTAYLYENLQDVDKEAAQDTAKFMEEKCAKFRATQHMWEEKFLNRYIERVNTKDWGE